MAGTRAQFIKKYKGHDRLAEYEIPAGPLEWLVDDLTDAGSYRTEIGLNGLINLPLSWREIRDWSEMTGVAMSPVFYRGILHLSAALVDQIDRSRKMECVAPFEPE